MWQKLYFGSVLLFFLLMNALLWRSVLGPQNTSLPVPVDAVLRRLLESADDSMLEIRRRGAKIGNGHWSATIQTSSTPAAGPDVALPEGMIPYISSYQIEFDGTLMLNPSNPLRFKCSLLLDTNQTWREFDLGLALRPSPLEIQASKPKSWEFNVRSAAAEKTIVVTLAHGQQVNRQIFGFDEAEHPERIFAALTTGLFAQRLEAMGFALGPIFAPATGPDLSPAGLSWKARTAHRKIGHSVVPVYQLEASLLDSPLFLLSILESGEILRVELPGDLVLVNADLLSM